MWARVRRSARAALPSATASVIASWSCAHDETWLLWRACRGGRHERDVELPVNGEALRHVIRDLTLPAHRFTHTLDLVCVTALSRQACSTRLEHEPGPPRLLHVREVAPRDGRASVRDELHKAFADKTRERLPERCPGDAELRCERFLAKTRSGRELARDDSLE